MKEIGAREAKNQFGKLLDAAQRAPVRVTKKGRPVGVFMSEEQYHLLRGAAWDRLQEAIVAIRNQAERSGLNDEALEDLLRDQS